MDQKKKKEKKPNNMKSCVVYMCDDKPTFHIYIYIYICNNYKKNNKIKK